MGNRKKGKNDAYDKGNQSLESDESDSSEEKESALIILEAMESLFKISNAEDKVDLAFGSGQHAAGNDNSIWLGDTRASFHMTNSTDGLVNLVPKQSWIVFGNVQRLESTHIGELVGTVEQKDGEKKQIKMKNVKLVPDLYVNLFSLSTVLKEGCDLEGSADKLTIKKGEKKYFFDRKIKIEKGYIFGIKIMKRSEPEGKRHDQKGQSYNIMKCPDMPAKH